MIYGQHPYADTASGYGQQYVASGQRVVVIVCV